MWKDKYIPSISISFDKRFLCLGAYWTWNKSVESSYRQLVICLFIVPMVNIHIEWAWGYK